MRVRLRVVLIAALVCAPSLVFESCKQNTTSIAANKSPFVPCAMPSANGDVTVNAEPSAYDFPVDFNSHMARVRALMQCMPPFNDVAMPQGVHWLRFRPNWYADTVTLTSHGELWITYWPKTDSSHPLEYLGRLAGGVLRPFRIPQQPYYELKLNEPQAAFPSVTGMQQFTGEMLSWVILPGGKVVDARAVPHRLKRSTLPYPLCKEGSPKSSVALYGLFPDNTWHPILTWRAWQTATFGIWRYSQYFPISCVGRFAGYFWATDDSAGSGPLYRIQNGQIVQVTAARSYLVTDKVMLLGDGDQYIEAHAR